MILWCIATDQNQKRAGFDEQLQVAFHNEPDMRNLEQFKSWAGFQVFLFSKSDISYLPKK